MATDEYVARAVAAGATYDDLPPRVRALLPASEWRARVRGACASAGAAWGGSPAAGVCGEGEYYEGLVKLFREGWRIYPYHLAHYVARVLRITPADYYTDMLVSALAARLPYSALPNFTAADAASVLAIGRNEYIDAANKAAAARRGPFKPSRAALRDALAPPRAPRVPPAAAPWWRAHAVNVGDAEFRALAPAELDAARAAAAPGGAEVGGVDGAALASLYGRGLLYLSVPLAPSDAVTVSSLEGFVSNRDGDGGRGGRRGQSGGGGGGGGGGAGAGGAAGPARAAAASTAASPTDGDPLEAALYAVLLAAGPATTLARLGDLLGLDAGRVAAAVGVAARLGFASVDKKGGGEAGEAAPAAAAASDAASPPPPPPSSRAVALVVDAAVASLLMVGALAPGLQRHAVTLFEGGRVAGAAPLADLLSQLDASAAAAAEFEGDAASLGDGAAALAAALRCLGASEGGAGEGGSDAGGRGVELLRKESLAGLAPAAAARLLTHSYAAVVVGAPCAPPPLPSCRGGGGDSDGAAAPVLYGPTAAAATPWRHVALWAAAGAAPPGAVVLPAGTLLRALPPPLARARAALVLAWPTDGAPRGARAVPAALGAGLVAAPFLLPGLNDALARGAAVVVPLASDEAAALAAVDVPLPLPPPPLPPTLTGVSLDTGAPVAVATPPGLARAAAALGLGAAVGALRFVRLPTAAAAAADGHAAAAFSLFGLTLGLPLSPLPVTVAVCAAASAAGFLGADALARAREGAASSRAALAAVVAAHGAVADDGGRTDDDDDGGVPPPAHALAFEGGRVARLGGGGWRHGGASAGEVD